jgi:RNA polymerase sigma-70 factor, ECF subfamily
MVENSPYAMVQTPAGNGPTTEIVRLVAAFHAPLFGYAYRLTGSVQDAEDLTQQAFLAAQTGLAGLRDAGSARGWLFAIVRNAWLKSRRKPRPMTAADIDLLLDQVPEETPEDNEIDPDRLQAALDDLPDEFKLVVTMFYYEGCSYREIAVALDVPIGTVMSRLSRAKGHLRARLFEPAYHAAVGGSHGSTK